MPVRLDETDVAILKALMEDGRKPLSQIAKVARVSTPTVESRLRKMVDMGLVKKIRPILDATKIRESVTAFVSLKVNTTNLEEAVKHLSQMDQVKGAYLTIGDANLSLMVTSDSLASLQDFLANKLRSIGEATVVSSNIVSKVAKEEQTIDLRPGLGIIVKCNTCDGEIAGEPFSLTVGGHDKFFCCKTCLSTYKERYASKTSNILPVRR